MHMSLLKDVGLLLLGVHVVTWWRAVAMFVGQQSPSRPRLGRRDPRNVRPPALDVGKMPPHGTAFPTLNDDPDVACNHYDLPTDAPEMMRHVERSEPLSCARGVVGVRGDQVFVKPEFSEELDCNFTEIVRLDDYTDVYLQTANMTNDGWYTLTNSEAVKVQCLNKTSKKSWSEVHVGVQRTPSVANASGWHRTPKGALPVNVLIWALDSTSRNSFMRKMNLSWPYMRDHMNGILMDGYNIIKESTFSCLCSIFTGYYTYESSGGKKTYVDDGMLRKTVWSTFGEAGYVTSFLEDEQNWGAFQHWGEGFRKQPAQHYIRPYMMAKGKNTGHRNKCCYGQSCNNVVQNYVRDLWETYADKPKILLSMLGIFSHGNFNDLDLIDQELLEMLKWMNSPSVANNTVIVIMADHGARSHKMSFTRQGILEMRRPFMYIILPKWIEQRWPLPVRNLKENSKRLVTAMDLHYTLLDLLNFDNEDFSAEPGLENIPPGLSMLKPMPKERTCKMAAIDTHYCACKRRAELDVTAGSRNEATLLKLSEKVTSTLNDEVWKHLKKCFSDFPQYVRFMEAGRNASSQLGRLHERETDKYYPFCKPWRFERVERAFVSIPSTGGKPVTGKGVDPRLQLLMEYELHIIASPGNSQFVATVTHHILNGWIDFDMRSLTRLDWYSPYSKCLKNVCKSSQLRDLESICHCGNTTELSDSRFL